MTSLIEQAAKRLEQIRQAGIAVPEVGEPAAAPATPAASGLSAAAAAAAGLEAERRGEVATGQGLQASRRVELALDRLTAAGIVTPQAPRSRLADQYRVIKRPLLANAALRDGTKIEHGNLIMVTSALSGEGKSFTSINLAMSIAAELDHTVMLVDADVARPSILKVLGLKEGPGLLDVLERKVELHEALLRTNVDKLSILPAGTPHPQATELLASEAMSDLLEEMATRYPDRIIIFDSPPLLLTTESRVLATHMGQIVVVVRAEHTLRSSVMQALVTIEACPVKMMVLNRARDSAIGSYGSYGYGYGYGYGEAEQGTSRPPAPGAAA